MRAASCGPYLPKECSLTDLDTYLGMAEKARHEADAAELDNVRDRCLRSAQAWEVMAERVRHTSRMRATIEAEKKRLAAVAFEGASPDPAEASLTQSK